MHVLPRPMWSWLLALALALAVCAQALAQTPFKPVPPLHGHVTDEVGMLTPDERQRLEAVLTDYETKTGSQIAVLLVASTEPEAIEQYGIRVTDAWKLGRKGVDDGVLLLVAKDNPRALRRLRIEAGRGVQGVLTDAQSKRILEDTIAPHFRQQDWYGGLVAGVGAIATLLNQEKFPAPQPQGAAPDSDGGGFVLGGLGVVVLFMFFGVFVFIRSFFRPVRLAQPGHPVQRATDWAGNAAGYVIGSMLDSALRSGGDDRRRDSSFSGGFSDSGGGGFSGGGGSFDGGGASGDW